eukprot:scaffold11764_cov114-Skeletonema_menzelii.AAC.1
MMYMMEYDKTIVDVDDGIIPIDASSTNGEPYNLVDVTSAIIPERMDIFPKFVSLLKETGELSL